MPTPLLFGSSFPLALIRRPVSIEPRSLTELQEQATRRRVVSFWGHVNTLAVARKILGFDPAPAGHRPALALDPLGFPCLSGLSFQEVWLLSPDYVPGFRPQIGQEVTPGQITGWQVLRLWFEKTPVL